MAVAEVRGLKADTGQAENGKWKPKQVAKTSSRTNQRLKKCQELSRQESRRAILGKAARQQPRRWDSIKRREQWMRCGVRGNVDKAGLGYGRSSEDIAQQRPWSYPFIELAVSGLS
jgi:hypothetical protein